jgi:hypothetical protein
MTDQIRGATPFLVPVERAADLIQRGIARNRAIIAFPWFFALFLRLLGFLPDAIRSRALSINPFRVASRK